MPQTKQKEEWVRHYKDQLNEFFGNGSGWYVSQSAGNIKLEVIAEDTLIEPWQSEFVVQTSKKVTVEVKGQGKKKPIKEVSNKPQVKIKNIKNNFNPVNDMVNTLSENGITLQKIIKNKKRIAPIFENYSIKVNYKGGTKKFIKEVINKLSKQ